MASNDTGRPNYPGASIGCSVDPQRAIMRKDEVFRAKLDTLKAVLSGPNALLTKDDSAGLAEAINEAFDRLKY